MTPPVRHRQLPKFAEDLFAHHEGAWLIPTAEVLAHQLRARGDARRGEASPAPHRAGRRASAPRPAAAGKDTRGMIRQHQFDKVELVSDHHAGGEPRRARAHDRVRRGGPEAARAAVPRACSCAPATWASPRAKTYDLEVWLPAQDTYREISIVLQLRRVPGAAHEGALSRRRGQKERTSCTRSTALASRSGAR